MSNALFDAHLNILLSDLKQEHLYKTEQLIKTPQSTQIALQSGSEMINFCANNYLGLANHPMMISAAQSALQSYGFGMASVRFICGTQTLHQTLESELSHFIGTEDTILYSSCFDANAGLFETLLTHEDAIISDALNHASIIDGIRLCKAKRYRYQHNDMQDLEQQLQQAQKDGARFILIVTDGVFSMDGTIANLSEICKLAQQYAALTMIDDCHSTGFLGDHGRGTHEHCNVMGQIDIITGTLGKALGGASGGYVCSRAPIIEYLRQRSRPYLFSNALAPSITAASLKALELIKTTPELSQRLFENTQYFRTQLTQMGFNILPGIHPIIPVMFGEAELAKRFSQTLISKGILAIDFSFPVVPKNQARIRLQMSAVHTSDQLERALGIFKQTAQELNI